MRRKRPPWLLAASAWMICASIVAGSMVVSPRTTAFAHPLSPSAPRDHSPRFRDGFVLVDFKTGTTPQQIQRLERAARARELRTLGVGVHLLSVPNGQVLAVVRLLNSAAGVRYAEPDYLMELAGVPNDPSFPIQWGYQNTGQTVNGTAGTPNDDERAVPAWDVTTGSKNIVIGETDTGVQYTHPDLAANIWTNPGGIGGCAAGTHGYNVLTGGCDPMDDDTVYGGHGTHVAGIMGAVGNNGVGVTGVNWNTTILPVKWVSSSGGNSTSNLITGLDWLVGAKQAGVNIRVVNDSTVFVGTAYSQALSDEIDKLGQNNILFVTAAGNTSDNNDNPALRRYPCGYDRPTEICVAASTQSDTLPSWANYGVSTVDLAAPGNNIYSTLLTSSYGFINGSSMASPQVAGTAALILSVQDMTASQLKADILEHVDLTPGLSGVVRTGGRLDVCKALPGCVMPNLPAPVLGLGSVGANSDTLAADTKVVNHYQLNSGAAVSKLSIYLQPTSTSGSQNIEGVIYADAGGAPGALLAISTPITFSSTNAAGWYDLPFASSVALTPGMFWVGVISGSTGGVAGIRWNTVTGSRASNSNSYASGPSNPFGGATINGEEMSLYATYTATAPAPGSYPFSVTPPAIVGAPGQPGPIIPMTGQTVSATTGTWDFSPTTYAYQWSRCDSTGINCAPIAGATSANYVPVTADANGTLRVSVTATNGNGSATDTSSPSQLVQAGSLPNTFGKTTIGQSFDSSGSNAERVEVFYINQAVSVTKLTIYLARNTSGQQVLQGVIYGDQSGLPGNLLAVSNEFTFSTAATTGWYDLNFASPVALPAGPYWIGLIDGATANVINLAYDNGPANSSDLIRPNYTSGPPNPFGSGTLSTEQISLYATYSATPPPPAPVNTAPPTISGTAQAGQALTATNGTWNNNPTSFAYQWLRCDTNGANCLAISGATNASYTLVSADVGATVEITVTASNAGGSASATSAPTAVVQPAPPPPAPVNTAPPTISGTAQAGQTLTGTNGTWSNNPTSYTYQWLRCDMTGANCAPVSGAISVTYALTNADVGFTLAIAVTATNAGGSATATSTTSAVIQAEPAPVNTAPPTISGTAQAGQALTATNGTWNNNPTSFAYQWLRCDTNGANCVAVSGATNASYALTSSDVGSTLAIAVTATNAGGSATATSATSAVIQAAPSGGTFGLSTIGSNTDTMVSNRKRVNHYQITVNASVSKLTMYLQPTGTSGSQNIEGVIYTDAGGAPGALLAVGTPITFSSTNAAGWYDLPFASPVALAPGTYWIGLISGTATKVTGFRWNNVSGSRALNNNTYSSGPSNPFGNATIDSEQMSLYATYTVSGPPLAPVNTALPTISGTAQAGQTLTGTNGTWSNNPTSYTYQWLRCDMTGANCVAVSGATTITYALTSSDVGSTLAIAVTATNGGGSATATSATSAVIQAAPSGGTFGLTSVGSNTDTMGANRKRVNHYQITVNASVSKLTMYLQPTSTSGSQVIEAVIYADSGGVPGALLAVGTQFTFSSTNAAGWYDLPFASPVALAPGTYWIGVISGDTGSVTGFRWNSVSGSRALNNNTYSSGPSNPFGSATIDSEQMSLYATYS